MRFVICLLMSIFATTVNADVHVGKYKNGTPYAVVYNTIEEGDAERLHQALHSNPMISDVWLNSPGGLTKEGWEMAAIIKDRGNVSTYIADGEYCGSACTYVFMGGFNRVVFGSGILAYHPAYLEKYPMELRIGEIALYSQRMTAENLMRYLAYVEGGKEWEAIQLLNEAYQNSSPQQLYEIDGARAVKAGLATDHRGAQR